MTTSPQIPHKSSHKATSVRLDELKYPLQKIAMEEDRSLNWLIKKIIKSYLENLKK